MKIYTVHDAKAEAYLQPFFMRTNGEAIRSFADACQTNEQFKKWPADYTLFELGEYDELTGVITPLKAIKSLGNGLDFKREQ